MSRRIDKIDKHIQRTFGELLLKEADIPLGVMVTVSRVETATNLRSCTVWLYISPLESADETLEGLKKQMYDLQGFINREAKLNPPPRIHLRLDRGLDHAENIEETLDNLKRNEGE
jgi:ribosome-binding factor A